MFTGILKNRTIKLNIYISLVFPLCLLMEPHQVAYYYEIWYQYLRIKGEINLIPVIIERLLLVYSLLGKIFDLIVLTEQCKSLQTDKLQFGFKHIHPPLFVQHY